MNNTCKLRQLLIDIIKYTIKYYKEKEEKKKDTNEFLNTE